VVIRTTHHLKSLRVTEENEILLTSRSAAAISAAQIQAFRRGHWTIENPIHVRDVSDCSEHRRRKKHCQR